MPSPKLSPSSWNNLQWKITGDKSSEKGKPHPALPGGLCVILGWVWRGMSGPAAETEAQEQSRAAGEREWGLSTTVQRYKPNESCAPTSREELPDSP